MSILLILFIILILLIILICSHYIQQTLTNKHVANINTPTKTIDDIKNMLQIIDNLFKKHNVTYCIDGGTLLGAVRHQDIIPWDDDADIIVLKNPISTRVSRNDQ